MHADHPHNGTVIVGGGLAGLTAAAYLARAGRRVTVLEKAPSLGGRAATQEQAGFAFNRGIHAIYTGGASSEVLAELGVTYSAGSPGQAFVLDQGRVLPFPWSTRAGPLAALGPARQAGAPPPVGGPAEGRRPRPGPQERPGVA